MPRAPLIAFGLCLPLLLMGCVGSDLDFDLRPDRISTRGAVQAAPRPAPDARGVISYDSYQMVVARRGDTVADVATRIGLSPEEFARFNGRTADEVLRPDEILAVPGGGGPDTAAGRDITAIASSAIAAAEARQPIPAGAAGTGGQAGAEPVRHQVRRGETAYSIARLYNVSVRALAEWNGLGSDLAVREGQFLIIPIVTEQAAAPGAASAPAASVTPLPPSATAPLPAPIERAVRPAPQAVTAPPAPAPQPSAATPARTARFARPVAGDILRPYGNGNEGIDIAAATGTPVRAAGDGEVAAITQNTDQIPILVVRHPDGLLTVYANIRNIAVSRGDRVTGGQTIAEVGGGNPAFLHFEVRRGFESVDPTNFLP